MSQEPNASTNSTDTLEKIRIEAENEDLYQQELAWEAEYAALQKAEEEALQERLDERAGEGGSEEKSKQVKVAGSYGCEKCKSLSVDNEMLDGFAIRVCFACKLRDPDLKLMTKSRAKEEFMLNDAQLKKLMSITKANPRKSGWSDMKLYCVRHLKETAIATWGSLDGVEDEKSRRVEARMKRRRKLKRKSGEEAKSGTELIQDSISELRQTIYGEDALVVDKKPSSKKKSKVSLVHERYHTHSFRQVEGQSELGVVKEKCEGCGMTREVECM